MPAVTTLRKRVISLQISLISYAGALQTILQLGKTKTPSYACFANAHMTVEAKKSLVFKNQVDQSTFTFADGMPLVFALRMLYGIKQERIAGMDFMGSVLHECEKNQLPVFFYGSTPEVLQQLKNKVQEKFPALAVAGMISPPFRPLTNEETGRMIDSINSSGAHLVFVGLGCPKQEMWMANNSRHINACLLGVGGAFEIYAGLAKRAPQWMCRAGLEWLFRFSQEPRRLFKRYAVTNTYFVCLFIKQFLLLRVFKRM
ncbi:MAG: N-acetylmannosaminyltransferase [Cytophagales bacterium]|jgi:N-acetylglucosaminyldiphosphoundecaprenol N-acetyl-beta-D-mannosaminyltransferase|nr:WecB/TagA/CpsF family glycosyltransferase [Bacteroidota bacterium]MBS1982317.1 WecB/TagA/CpsF family glycosyltransferase [Bacteroidota bacterium]WHZ07583.1 MAG: N-acetylmannosaminyltransferase [Cytophagales bacterium]